MNSFKTALRNIKKSSKDYSVYFLTLIIGVAIFYMFNSVGSQSFMETIVASNNSSLKMLVRIIEVISVVVAFILGLLMVYANNFLIKRRKKEFGVYMMLGMGRKKVAKILSIETVMVGIISLAAGLLVGVLGSQFLSIIVGKLFEADLSAYRFSFSAAVLVKTVIYFAIIFLVVLIFNTKTLAKYQLIDLLNSKKSAEKRLIRNTTLSVILFIVAVAALIFAYVEIGFRGKTINAREFVASVVVGLVGNFLFFFALAGFLPALLKKFKGFYFNKLNAFVAAQFGHNINSSAGSFALISILLFLAICAFSVGFSMNGYLNSRIKNATPVDVSAENLNGTVSDLLIANGYEPDQLMDGYCEVPIYQTNQITIASTVNAAMDIAQKTFPLAKWETEENIVRLSDYNMLEEMYGRKPIVLADNEYAMICDFDILTDIVNEAIKNGNIITVNGTELVSGYNKCVEEYVLMSGMSAAMGVVVLPDAVVDNNPDAFEAVGSVFAGNYREIVPEEDTDTEGANGPSKSDYAVVYGDGVFEDVFGTVDENSATAQYTTRTQVHESSVGTSVSVVFIVLYIGIVFIITGAAVIALKILSDSMDSVEKYSILMRIGADRKMRERALFAQTFFNFVLPLVIGLIHSVFALRYAKGVLVAIGMTRMFSGTVIAVLVMVLIYGGYCLITYEACRRVVIGAEK